MKTNQKSLFGLLFIALLSPVFLSAKGGWGNDRFPGDDFSLEGALQLFKNANTLEDFERDLNYTDNYVNNLDLNNNGKIDYLRVADHMEGDVHAIVIQDLLDHNTAQDVAVIEVKRAGNGEAFLQIIGDADLYGTERIVEPYPYDDEYGPVSSTYDDYYYYNYSPTVYVNVMLWPSVRYIFAPHYVVWASPWYWDYYPSWYSPWRPQPWNDWHRHTIVYHHYYRVAPQCRIPEAGHFYGPRRKSAPQVHERTQHLVKENGGRTRGSDQRRSDANVVDNNRAKDRASFTDQSTRTGIEKRDASPSRQPRRESPRIESRESKPSRETEQTSRQTTQQPRVSPPKQETARQAPRDTGNRSAENRSTTSGNVRNQPSAQREQSSRSQRAPVSPRASSPAVKPSSSNSRVENNTRSNSTSRSTAPAKNQSQKQGRGQ